MSLATRTSSALCKRAEQLKRWEESDTNREPVSPKQKSRRVKFSSGCVFLAACAAGDKDEVLKLLDKGADINTANVDGLTALHQACIDDNLDMVEFLVEHGADVNRGDNEGWTPLHATASCGFLYIAKYLIEKGANVAAVNNDRELVIDVANGPKMEDLLREEIQKRDIDCDVARNEEEKIMLSHAKEWLSTKSSLVNKQNTKDGATPLHVASAKGYNDVIKLLLQCEADLDAQDIEGWTPLHAAAHWGQRAVCQILAESSADMDAKNFVGQTPFDLADTDEFRYFLEDLKKAQNKEEVINRRQTKKKLDVDQTQESETPSKVKKVEVEITESQKNLTEKIEKKNKVNSIAAEAEKNETNKENKENTALPPSSPSKQIETNPEEGSPVWRKNRQAKAESIKNSGSFRARSNSTDINNENEVTIRRANSFKTDKEFYTKYMALHERIKASSNPCPRPVSDIILPTYLNSFQQNYNRPSKEEENSTTTSSTTTSTTPSPTSPVASNPPQPVRRSFVPPVRDEESETQRKAHAKRVRETRRSTQGVTLEEIKSAEQFVKNQTNPNNNNNPEFKLEDATKPTENPSTPSFIRRTQNNTNPRPSSAPIETADTTITIPLRKIKQQDDKEQDKENDVRNAQATLATQAAIQRRRRPKRRSTGVVNFENVDDVEQEKDPAGGDYEVNVKLNHEESGTDRSSRSRLNSTSDIRNENGEIDYKKLYEEAMVDNERLKDKLRKQDEELRDTKQTLEKINVVTSKNSLSELEKRERRAMERKLSEMEEELKQLQKLKAENERLKADNKSLTRVINKLTESAKK